MDEISTVYDYDLGSFFVYYKHDLIGYYEPEGAGYLDLSLASLDMLSKLTMDIVQQLEDLFNLLVPEDA